MTATPEELQSALAKDPAAKSAFEALPPSHRKEYADWVAGAKKPEFCFHLTYGWINIRTHLDRGIVAWVMTS